MTEKKKWYYTTIERMNMIFGIGILLIAIPVVVFDIKLPNNTKQKIIKPDPIQYLTNIVIKKQPRIDPSIAKPIAEAVFKYSKKYKFPPELIISIIEQESSFNQMSVSSASCVGLMQINSKMHPKKLIKLGIKGAQVFHIDNNIHLGTVILYEYYDSTKTISGALQKYLGAANKEYILNILSSFADLITQK